MSPIWVIALNNYKEIIRERLLYGVLVAALLVTASSFFLATISLDQNARVLQNVGLAAIHLFTLFICVFVATNSIRKDYDRRALYLLFPKPISRSHYVLGKYVGILLLLITTLVILGVCFILGALATDRTVILGALINLSYSFLEISLLLALALLFATFAAPLNAALYTLALFLIGHSLTLLRNFADRLPNTFLHGVANLCYYLLPNLEKFDVREAVLYGVHIPPATVLLAIAYWAVYVGLALFLGVAVVKSQEV